MQFGISLVVQWLGLHLPMKEVHVLPLVWGAGIPHALRWKNQKMKQEQYCNIFNKDLKIYATQCKKKIQLKNGQKICTDIFFSSKKLFRWPADTWKGWSISLIISSVQFSRSVLSSSLRPHESQHARPPCPSPTPRVYPNPCPSSWWCHPAISSSVIPFSSCPQSFPALGSFPVSQLFAWGGQSIGVSASQWTPRTDLL